MIFSLWLLWIFKQRNWLFGISLSPLVIYLYPAVACFLATSKVPLILGRYSIFLAIFNIWNLSVYILAIWGFRRDNHVIKQLCYLSIIISSFLIMGNNELQRLPFISVVLLSVRFLAGLSMIILEFKHFQKIKTSASGIYLSIGMVIVLISLLDFGLLFWTQKTPRLAVPLTSRFRQSYDLNNITNNDIILIGDSFVWGAGVTGDETFGNVLERDFT